MAIPAQPESGKGVDPEKVINSELLDKSMLVVVIMGSDKDLEHAKKIQKRLNNFGVRCELRVGSAHKNPDYVLPMMHAYDADTTRQIVYFAVAGRSNALGGFMGGNTLNPVYSCPPKPDWYDLFSSTRLPSEVPVPVIIEPESAAMTALRIFALTRPELHQRLEAHQDNVLHDLIKADKIISAGNGT